MLVRIGDLLEIDARPLRGYLYVRLGRHDWYLGPR